MEHARQKLCQKEQVCSQTDKKCIGEGVGREAQESLQRGNKTQCSLVQGGVLLQELRVDGPLQGFLLIGSFPWALVFSAGKVMAPATLGCMLWRGLVGKIRGKQ